MSWEDIIDLQAIKREQYIFKNNLNLPDAIPIIIKQDMEIFNEVDKTIRNNEENIDFVKQLEVYRNFKPGFLVNKGIIYTDSNIYNRVPILKYSSLSKTDNTIMDNRFLLPIRLPNGRIFTYMGYSTGTLNRYIMPKVKDMQMYNYVNQGCLFGNVESIKRDSEVYFAEGFFDAYRIESEMNRPGIALLGSKLTDTKIRMLKKLKESLNLTYIYTPDFDENKAGTSEFLINNPIWDRLFNYNEGKDKTYKDIDQYYRMTRKYY